MKRMLSLVIVGVLIIGPGLPVSAAPGDLPERAPTSMIGATTWVYPRTTYTIACIDYGYLFYGYPASMTMLAYTLNDQRGKRLASSIQVNDSFNGEFVTASGAGTAVTHTTARTQNDEPASAVTTITIKPKVPGILRVGHASWDGYAACFLAYGRGFAGFQFQPLPISRARMLYTGDFATSGVGITTAKASVSALQSYTRSTKGFMFSLFRVGAGASKVVDPKNKVRFESTGTTNRSASFVEASKGTWTYSLDAHMTQSRSPALWVMDLV